MPHPDDDPVVAELDVFLSHPPPDSKLHVLQYPLRHSRVGVGADRRVNLVHIRPNHRRIEVKLSVLPDDPSVPSDDPTCATQSGRSFDPTQPAAHTKPIGTLQSLRSRAYPVVPDCNFAMLSLVSSSSDTSSTPAAMLLPVHAVSQLRPVFDYLDAQDLATARRKVEENLMRAAARGEGPVPGANGGDDGVSPLELSFRRRETERAAERRKNSHSTLRQQEEGEQWIELDYTSVKSDEGKRRRQELLSLGQRDTTTTASKQEESFEDGSKYTDLFAKHVKGDRGDVTAKMTASGRESSLRMLKQQATPMAVSQLMAYARMASFSEVNEAIGLRPAKEVLTALRSCALCLRGCWVCKKGAKDLRRQAGASERYEACRILVLGMFRKTRVVKVSEAEQEIGEQLVIGEDSVQAILKEVGVFRRGRGWELKVDDDLEFIAGNSLLCRTQDVEWDKRLVKAREVVAKCCRTAPSRRMSAG